MTMQRFYCGATGMEEGKGGEWVLFDEVSITRIMLDVVPGADGMGEEVYATCVADVEKMLSAMGDQIKSLESQLAQATEVKHPSWHVSKSEHEQLQHERDTLRDVLRLLAPDLKTMAILYAQKGDHQRSQALANICKSVGVE